MRIKSLTRVNDSEIFDEKINCKTNCKNMCSAFRIRRSHISDVIVSFIANSWVKYIYQDSEQALNLLAKHQTTI